MSRAFLRACGALLPAAAAFLAAGCGTPVTHLDPADDATWAALNEQAEIHPVRIRRTGSGTFAPADEVRFAPDTTRWRDEAGEARAVSTDAIARISFRSRRLGALKGARGGFLIGLPFTAAALWLTTPSLEFEAAGSDLWTLALLAPVILGGVGGASGALNGADDVIVLGVPPPPDTRYLPGSGAPAPGYVTERSAE
ncbi:MAG TPA: hypothetical protein VKU85_07235 [bacterium]|nr:hypothetical protein [bacterium]